MSQELESQFEAARSRFEEAVWRWREVGASDHVIKSELAYILQEKIEEPSRDSATGD